MVEADGLWSPHQYGEYHPVVVEVTAFWRPWLQERPTSHYIAEAGKALPAIALGIIARVGRVGGQRLRGLDLRRRDQPSRPHRFLGLLASTHARTGRPDAGASPGALSRPVAR